RFNSIAAYEKLGDMDTARTLLKEYVADYPDDESAVKEAQFWETR
ncbi:MAG: tetratricopeptide repeat protein, partial [Lachnospiraceae bacterium]|nr:tetratricopeptide repeat protein [Lachnospiraceae bacterium]